jgi:hypothetical protein
MAEFLDQSQGSRWVMIEWQRAPGNPWEGVKVPTPRLHATELISDAIARDLAPKYAYRIIPTESPNGPMTEEVKNRLRSAGTNGDHAAQERGERKHPMPKEKAEWMEVTVAGLPADRTGRLKAAQAFMNVPGVKDWKWSGGMFKEPATIIYQGTLDLSKVPEGVTITGNEPEPAQPVSEGQPPDAPDAKSSGAHTPKPSKKRKNKTVVKKGK